MTIEADGSVADILRDFGGDPQRAEGLAGVSLGFEPIPNPEDRLTGPLSGGLKQFLRGPNDGGFGVSELYRVGSRKADPAEAGLWVGVLSDWGYRSADRDRSRRRITRALVEHVPDRRSLALLVPPSIDPRREAELVFPRTHRLDPPMRRSEQCSRSPWTSTILPASIGNFCEVSVILSRPRACWRFRGLWQRQFSVERVTTGFYQEYATVRDRIAKALLTPQPEPSGGQSPPWATMKLALGPRDQMGRVLFLWFLQAKGWLGEPGADAAPPTYLLNLWDKRRSQRRTRVSTTVAFLAPMFFDAMATGSSSRGEHPGIWFRTLSKWRPVPPERSGRPYRRRGGGHPAGRGIRSRCRQ